MSRVELVGHDGDLMLGRADLEADLMTGRVSDWTEAQPWNMSTTRKCTKFGQYLTCRCKLNAASEMDDRSRLRAMCKVPVELRHCNGWTL